MARLDIQTQDKIIDYMMQSGTYTPPEIVLMYSVPKSKRQNTLMEIKRLCDYHGLKYKINVEHEDLTMKSHTYFEIGVSNKKPIKNGRHHKMVVNKLDAFTAVFQSAVLLQNFTKEDNDKMDEKLN